MRSTQIISTNTAYPSAVNNKVIEAKEYNDLQYDVQELYNQLFDSISTITHDYKIQPTDTLLICNKSTPMSLILPVSSGGQILRIKNIGKGLVTVYGDIDGESYQEIYQWSCLYIQCYQYNKWIIL